MGISRSDRFVDEVCALNTHKLILFLCPEFEAGFVRLLDKLTNGTRIEVDVTGEHSDIIIVYYRNSYQFYINLQ